MKKMANYEYRPRRIAVKYLLISAFCLTVFIVYNMFSHGVMSPFMTFLFAWPLVLGVIPALLFCFMPAEKKHLFPSLITARLWRSGVAALTMGSLLIGIFEIAGTGSAFAAYLMIAGIFFLCAGAVVGGIELLTVYKNDDVVR